MTIIPVLCAYLRRLPSRRPVYYLLAVQMFIVITSNLQHPPLLLCFNHWIAPSTGHQKQKTWVKFDHRATWRKEVGKTNIILLYPLVQICFLKICTRTSPGFDCSCTRNRGKSGWTSERVHTVAWVSVCTCSPWSNHKQSVARSLA